MEYCGGQGSIQQACRTGRGEERLRTHLSIFASPVLDMAGGRLTRDEQMIRAAFVKKCCTTKLALSLKLCSFPSDERTVWLPEDKSSLEYVRLAMVSLVLDCLGEVWVAVAGTAALVEGRGCWCMVYGIGCWVGLCLYRGVLDMAYILSGCIPDGQAIHHSDSRQVLNLDGGSAVVGDRAGMDDDEGYTAGLWLHDDRGRQAVSWMMNGSRVARSGGPDGVVWWWSLITVDDMQLVTRRSR
jgi:hypothetical protein